MANNGTITLSARNGSKHLSWFIVLLSLALAAWLLAGTLHRIIIEDQRDIPASPSALFGSGPAPDLLPGVASGTELELGGDLFSSSRSPRPLPPGRDGIPQAPPEGPGAALETSALPVSLVGTVVASEPRWSLATIVNRTDSSTDLYRIGDHLLGRAVIRAILTDRVVVQRGDRYQVIRHVGAATEKTVERSQLVVAEQAAGLVQRLGPDSYRVNRDRLKPLLANPGSLIHRTRVTLAFDTDGSVQGIRLAGVGPGSLFAQLGLEARDVIRRINDFPVDGPERMLEILQRLRSASDIELEVSRAGSLRTLNYRIE